MGRGANFYRWYHFFEGSFNPTTAIAVVAPPFPPLPELGGKRPTARGSIYPTSSVCQKRHFRRRFLSTSRLATPKKPSELESPSHAQDDAVNRMPKFRLVLILPDFEICRFHSRKCGSIFQTLRLSRFKNQTNWASSMKFGVDIPCGIPYGHF